MKRFVAKLRLKCIDAKTAKTIYTSLYPDNLCVPKYMVIEQFLSENTYEIHYVIKIHYENGEEERKIMSLKSTLDDILSSVSLVEKTLLQLAVKEKV